MTYVNPEWLEDSGKALSLAAVGLWQLASDRVEGGTFERLQREVGIRWVVETFGGEGVRALAELVAADIMRPKNDRVFVLLRSTPRERTEAWFKRERARAAEIRDEIIQMNGLTCHICGEDVEEDDVHVDHIVPLSRGGDSDFRNLGVAHSTCNLRKGARIQ